jgi:nucleoside-diphosphate-sugar epimerase
VVIRSEANIRELLDRVNEMLAHKEILQFAAMTYRDSNRTTQLTKNDELLYQLNKLSLEVIKDTLDWVLKEQDSFINQFVQDANSYDMPEQSKTTLF